MSMWHLGPKHRPLLFKCDLLNKERDNLISIVLKTDVWPISKTDLIRKYFKTFAKFTKEMSFNKLNHRD